MTDDKIFEEESNAVNDRVWGEVHPILQEIEDEYPEQSAYYAIFVDAIHALLYQGWTKEELLKDVEDHFELFSSDNQSELH